jgi:VanZ family protein
MSENAPHITGSRPAGHWLWAVAVMVTVFFASGRSQVASPSIVNFDKVAHGLVFGLIATLIARSFTARAWMWAAIALASAYGGADEFRQSFTAGRSVEFADWVADTSGAALAVTLYLRWAWYRRVLETPLFRRKRRVEKSIAPVPTDAASL